MLVEHGDETLNRPGATSLSRCLYFSGSGAPTLWIISRDASALGVKAGLLSTATIWDGTMTIWVTVPVRYPLTDASPGSQRSLGRRVHPQRLSARGRHLHALFRTESQSFLGARAFLLKAPAAPRTKPYSRGAKPLRRILRRPSSGPLGRFSREWGGRGSRTWPARPNWGASIKHRQRTRRQPSRLVMRRRCYREDLPHSALQEVSDQAAWRGDRSRDLRLRLGGEPANPGPSLTRAPDRSGWLGRRVHPQRLSACGRPHTCSFSDRKPVLSWSRSPSRSEGLVSSAAIAFAPAAVSLSA